MLCHLTRRIRLLRNQAELETKHIPGLSTHVGVAARCSEREGEPLSRGMFQYSQARAALSSPASPRKSNIPLAARRSLRRILIQGERTGLPVSVGGGWRGHASEEQLGRGR